MYWGWVANCSLIAGAPRTVSSVRSCRIALAYHSGVPRSFRMPGRYVL